MVPTLKIVSNATLDAWIAIMVDDAWCYCIYGVLGTQFGACHSRRVWIAILADNMTTLNAIAIHGFAVWKRGWFTPLIIWPFMCSEHGPVPWVLDMRASTVGRYFEEWSSGMKLATPPDHQRVYFVFQLACCSLPKHLVLTTWSFSTLSQSFYSPHLVDLGCIVVCS